jgi:hypothetical protein
MWSESVVMFASGVCSKCAGMAKTKEIRRAERGLEPIISSTMAHMEYALTRQLGHGLLRTDAKSPFNTVQFTFDLPLPSLVGLHYL